MKVIKKTIIVLSLLFSINSLYANAGSQQNETPKLAKESIVEFAKQVERFAAAKGARAFIISRLGQATSSLPKGIEFTHTAIAIYSSITLDNGETAKGYAIYNLYQKPNNPDRSEIVVDYPVDFFWGVHELKSGIIIPSDDLQFKLIEAIQQGNQHKLHNPRYSLIANPNNNKYQNCTEHTLNMVNSAIYDTTEMNEIKSATKQFFRPQRVNISPIKLALGGLFVDGIKTSDHGRKKYTTTFNSISKYLKTYGLQKSMHIVKYEGV